MFRHARTVLLSLLFFVGATAARGVAGCAGGNPGTPNTVNRLYVSQFLSGQIVAYQLPLHIGSQPIAISNPNPGRNYTAIATDSGGAIYATNDSSQQVGNPTLEIFVPLENGSTPYLYLKTWTHPLDVAVDRLGRAFVAEECLGDPPPCTDEIEVWVPPFGFNQHSAFQILTPKPFALAFDPQNNLWVVHRNPPLISEYLGSVTDTTTTPVLQTNAGLAGPPVTIRFGSNGTMYAVQGSGLGVAVFQPPLTASMVPTTTLAIPPGNIGTGVAIDDDGTVYAGYSNNTVVGYPPGSTVQNVAVTPPLEIVLSLAIGPGPPGTPLPPTSGPTSTPTGGG